MNMLNVQVGHQVGQAGPVEVAPSEGWSPGGARFMATG